jgi:2-oxoglutarate ferredoxin oxidoreductase subunit alpha
VELPNSVTRTGDENPDIIFVGMGSNYGSIREACERLQADGLSVAHAHMHVLLPFPTNALRDAISTAKRVVVVENNATGQLKHLMGYFGVNHPNVTSLLKYDGRPFLPVEIYHFAKEMK